MNTLSDWLLAIEQSALGNAVRDLGGWGYALINLTHILGVAVLFGSVLILDLRLLGWRRQIPLDAIASSTLPLVKFGFVIAVASGIGLLSANASDYAANPFLLIKFIALVLTLVNAYLIRQIPAWQARRQIEPIGSENSVLARAGLASLACWLAVIAAGRLIAYW
ncbi:MAG TPA: DUF6644 family protein [Cellvibrio sp.]